MSSGAIPFLAKSNSSKQYAMRGIKAGFSRCSSAENTSRGDYDSISLLSVQELKAPDPTLRRSSAGTFISPNLCPFRAAPS